MRLIVNKASLLSSEIEIITSCNDNLYNFLHRICLKYQQSAVLVLVSVNLILHCYVNNSWLKMRVMTTCQAFDAVFFLNNIIKKLARAKSEPSVYILIIKAINI